MLRLKPSMFQLNTENVMELGRPVEEEGLVEEVLGLDFVGFVASTKLVDLSETGSLNDCLIQK